MPHAGGSVCVLGTGHRWEEEDINDGEYQLVLIQKNVSEDEHSAAG